MEWVYCSLGCRLDPRTVWPTLQQHGARLMHFNFASLQDPAIQEKGIIDFRLDARLTDLEQRLRAIGQAIALDENFRIVFYPEQSPVKLFVVTGDSSDHDHTDDGSTS